MKKVLFSFLITIAVSWTAMGQALTGTSLVVNGSILQNADNTAFGIDAQANPRFGFIKKFGWLPVIASDMNSPIVFAQTNQTGIFTNISGATLTERMRINSNGKIGIGTPAPQAQFEILGPGSNEIHQFRVRHPSETEVAWGLTLRQMDDLSGLIAMGGRDLKVVTGWDKSLYLGATEYNTYGGKVIFPGGKVGIGIATPQAKLDVNSSGMVALKVGGNSSAYQGADITISRTNTSSEAGKGATLQFTDNGSGNHNMIQSSSAGLQFYTNYGNAGWIESFRIKGSGDTYFGGKMSIGTGIVDANYQLIVNGKIKTKEIKVTQLNWADYVFNEDYNLRPLSAVASYIEEHKHLPEIPSAEEVQKNGIDVGEMNALLLMKVEELTLYIIAQDKRIRELENKSK